MPASRGPLGERCYIQTLVEKPRQHLLPQVKTDQAPNSEMITAQAAAWLWEEEG